MYRAGRARTRTPNVRGSEHCSLPPPNTLNTHGAAGVAYPSFAPVWTLTRSALRSSRRIKFMQTAVNHSPTNPHRPARPTRALATCSDQRGEGVTEREIGRQLAGGSDLGRAGVASCACGLGRMRSRGCRLDACTRREKRMGGSATQHTLDRGFAGRRPQGMARRRRGMLSRPA